MPITRLGLDGYGVRRVGTFAGKTPDFGSSHPVGKIAKLSLDGYGARRNGFFGGKTPSDAGVIAPDWIVLARRRGRR